MGAENEAPTIVKTCPNQPKQTQKSDCTKSKKRKVPLRIRIPANTVI